MNILLTGAGGFIGHNITNYLLNQGCKVTGISRRQHLEIVHKNFNNIILDLNNEFSLSDKFDLIIHCAAILPAYCPDDILLFNQNLQTTLNVFKFASAANITRIINMSSMSVFGEIYEKVVTENTPINHQDTYGQSKHVGEFIANNWSKNGKNSSVSIRLPGIVGKGGANNFICKTNSLIANDLPITAVNPNALFNNIVHTNQLSEFIITLFQTIKKGHEHLTIGSTDPLKIHEILERIYLQHQKKPKITWLDSKDKSFQISYENAKNLGFRPLRVVDSLDLYLNNP